MFNPIFGKKYSFCFICYLESKRSQYNAAENGVPVDSFKHIPLSMDFAGIDFVKELHQDEDIKDDGVMFGWLGVEKCAAAAINVKELLTYKDRTKLLI